MVQRSAVVLHDTGIGWPLGVADELRSFGVTPMLVTGSAEVHRFAGPYEGVERVDDPFDAATVLAAARRLTAGSELVGVVTSSDGVMVTAAQVNRLLGRSTADPAAIGRARDTYAAVRATTSDREYCLDVVVRDGVAEPLAIVDKMLVDDRSSGYAFVWPPELDEQRQELVRQAAIDAVAAVGLDRILAHVEVLDDATRGPTVVGIIPGRPGGQLLGRLHQLVTGVDGAAEALALQLGLPAPERKPPELPLPMAALSMVVPGSGRVTAVDGLAEIAALPDVIEVVPAAQVGDVISSGYGVSLLVSTMDGAGAVRETYALARNLLRLATAEGSRSALDHLGREIERPVLHLREPEQR